jgi:hypothetical protein
LYGGFFATSSHEQSSVYPNITPGTIPIKKETRENHVEYSFWEGVSGSAVLHGALAATFIPIKKNINCYIMAYGTGVLIDVTAYELFADSVRDGEIRPTSIGYVGAVVFTVLDFLITKKGA